MSTENQKKNPESCGLKIIFFIERKKVIGKYRHMKKVHFIIKNIFHKMDLRLFYFRMTIYIFINFRKTSELEYELGRQCHPTPSL